MPKEKLEILNKAPNEALGSETIQKKFSEIGIQPMPMSSEELGSFAKSEHDSWGKLIRDLDIKLSN